MTIRFAYLALAAVLLSATAGRSCADEAAEAFDSLYGKDVKRVAATAETADDLALARKLLAAAKETSLHRALAVVLCENAFRLAAKDPQGADTAAAAMALAAEKEPQREAQFLEQVVGLRRRAYEAAKPDDRTPTGHALAAALLAAGDAKVRTGDTDGAAKLLEQALAVAGAVKSPLEVKVRKSLDALAARAKAEVLAKELQKKLEADAQNATVRAELVRLYAVELDDPAEAAKFLGDGVDAAFRKYVPAAAKGLEETPELACLELGDWYRGLADAASPAGKEAMLRRAKAYYERFLDLHADEDLKRSQASLALKKVTDALGASRPAAGTAQTPPKGKPLATNTWIDVLKLVDPEKDALDGRALQLWQRQGRSLVGTPTRTTTRLALPVTVDGDYEFQVKFARPRIQGYVYIYLPVGPTSVALRLYSGISGLCYVNGDSPYSNGTGVGTALKVNFVHTVDAKVSVKDADATIAINMDSRPLIRWQGPVTALSGPGAIPRNHLGFAVSETATTFGAARLRVISGGARSVRAAGGAR